MTRFGISVSLIAVILLFSVGFFVYKSKNNTSNDIFGTQPLIANFEECAKAGYPVMESYPRQCRTPDNTFFVETIANPNPVIPIPVPKPTEKIAAGSVGGYVTIGPFCPVEREDQPCEIPPEAYTSRQVVVYENNGTTVKERANLDAQGNYKITLAPGNYFIQIDPAGIGPGEKKYVTVKSFETAIVNFDIDTGIR